TLFPYTTLFRTHTLTHAHTYTQTYTHIHTDTHTYTQTNTHTHRHTHMHTKTTILRERWRSLKLKKNTSCITDMGDDNSDIDYLALTAPCHQGMTPLTT